MLIGASSGSTSGGMKCIRLLLLWKILRNEFKRIVHPNAVLPIRVSKRVVSPNIVSGVLAFVTVYVGLIIVSTLALSLMGVRFEEGLGTVISSLSNMGPGLGTTGPAYTWSGLPDAAKWVLSFLMLVGRLELFTILVLFSPEFWKKR
jgi:trk system potassium uptake protein TrkH